MSTIGNIQKKQIDSFLLGTSKYDSRPGETANVYLYQDGGVRYAYKEYKEEYKSDCSKMPRYLDSLFGGISKEIYSKMRSIGAFPLYYIYDDSAFCGFVMDRMPDSCYEGFESNVHSGKQERDLSTVLSYVETLDDNNLAGFVTDLEQIILFFHRRGIMLNDVLSARNICFRKDGRRLHPYLIDTDSMMLGNSHPLEIYDSANYEPPVNELFNRSIKTDIYKFSHFVLRLFAKDTPPEKRAELDSSNQNAIDFNKSLGHIEHVFGKEYRELIVKGLSKTPSDRPDVGDLIAAHEMKNRAKSLNAQSRTKMDGTSERLGKQPGSTAEFHTDTDGRSPKEIQEELLAVLQALTRKEGKDGPPPKPAGGPKPGPNDPCPCGSGLKYKNCHGKKPPLLVDFGPNDPCPCGSGLKYKNCHGKKPEKPSQDTWQWLFEFVAEKLSRSTDGTTGDYTVNRQRVPMTVSLTFQGQKKAAALLDIQSLNEPAHAELMQGILQALIRKEEKAGPPPKPVGGPKPGPNDPCPCGSGLKYKNCHGKINSDDAVDTIVLAIIDFVTKSIKKEDYTIAFNYSGIKLSQSGRSKMQKFFKAFDRITNKYEIGNSTLENLFLITIAVNHFSTIWRKKFHFSNNVIDPRLLKLLASIVYDVEKSLNTANTSQRAIAKQLDDYITVSVFRQIKYSQLEEYERLLDLSEWGIADKKAASYMDSICDWKPTVIKCAYVLGTTGSTSTIIVVKQPDMNKPKQSPVDVNKIVESTRANRVKRVKASLLFSLLTSALLIAILALSRCEAPTPPWDSISRNVPLVAWCVYFFVGVGSFGFDEEYDGSKKYNKALWVVIAAVGLIVIGERSGILNGIGKDTVLFPRMTMLASNVYSLPIFALTAASSVRYLTEKDRSDQHIALYKKLSIILCSVLTVLLVIGVVKQVKGFNALNVGDTILFGSYEQDGDSSNGSEEISWTVHSIDDGKALLLSDVCLYAMPYNSDSSDNSWTNSDLRKWLNGEFYQSAFSSAEQGTICEDEITTGRLSNKEGHTYGEAEVTVDKVFVPDLSEFPELTSELNVSPVAKEVFSANNTAFGEENYQSMFWTRSPSGERQNLACGYTTERISYFTPPTMYAMVRPAIIIDVELYADMVKGN